MSYEFESLTALSQDETEQLILTIQSSLQIRRRYQFHIWAQSRLNAMVPHDVLVCGHRDPQRRGLSFDCFSMFPVPQETLERIYEPAAGLIASVLDIWNGAERTPCARDFRGGDSKAVAALAVALESSGMTDFVAHGVPSHYDAEAIDSFFCFVQAGGAVPVHIKREDKPLTARHTCILELLLPYLHATYVRIVAAERSREALRSGPVNTDPLITQREMEILDWVREGKSNKAIGDLLRISPLTVKNHVQKILRKLGASNRTQAVSRAISMGLIACTVTGN